MMRSVEEDRRDLEFVGELIQEVERARTKHPGGKHLTVALMEEVGELAKALLENEGSDRVREEAIQVACVALRIATEGDTDFVEPAEPQCWYLPGCFGLAPLHHIEGSKYLCDYCYRTLHTK
jgi:hypothetical protein